MVETEKEKAHHKGKIDIVNLPSNAAGMIDDNGVVRIREKDCEIIRLNSDKEE